MGVVGGTDALAEMLRHLNGSAQEAFAPSTKEARAHFLIVPNLAAKTDFVPVAFRTRDGACYW